MTVALDMDTKLFVSNQPGGLFAIRDAVECPGKIFWVGSNVTGASDSEGFGQNPGAPLATIDYAIGLTTASRGDVIYVLPGHAESKAAAGNIFLADMAGVTIQGIGSGSLMPTLTLGHADATASVTAANCKIRGLKFISDVADCAVGLTASATADGLIVEDCWLTDGGLTKELVIGISLAAACDNCLIRNNRFYTTVSAETGGCASAIKLVGESANSRIVGNISYGHYTVANIDGSTALATMLYIAHNHLVNIDTDAGVCIKLHANTTGICAQNYSSGTKATTHPHVGAAAYWFECYGNDAVNSNGLLSPAVGTFGA